LKTTFNAVIIFPRAASMLVCICKGVSDRRITEEIRRGACTLRQIQEGCQAGTDCKCCVRQIRQMLASSAHARQDTADVG
jgi:bacterioferritin-associated ferredoxin